MKTPIEVSAECRIAEALEFIDSIDAERHMDRPIHARVMVKAIRNILRPIELDREPGITPALAHVVDILLGGEE